MKNLDRRPRRASRGLVGQLALAVALCLMGAACKGTQAQPVEPTIPPDDVSSQNCCCKFMEWASDGESTFESMETMACSERSGTCVDDVQCQTGDNPPSE